MARTTLIGPPNNSMEFNTGDSTERGMHPKEIIENINAMTTELYTIGLGKALGATAALGDSRVAQINTQVGRQGGYNHFNWGNYRAGSRLTMVTNQGLSGDRTDQILARLGACLNSTAGHLYLLAGVNDIAQALVGYNTVNTIGPNQGAAVTLANVASVAAANILYCAQQFIANGGRIVTIVLDPGAENFTAAQVGAWLDYVQRLKEIDEQYTACNAFDAITPMHDPAASTASTIRFKAGYAQESSGSGVHQSNLGGYKTGIPFATYLQATFPALSFLPADVNEVPSANSLSSLLLNPLLIGTAGSLGTGITGSAPTSWTVERSGGGGTQTATSTVQAAADGGPGNECLIVPTFGAAGDIIRLKQDATIGNVNTGDIVQGMARVTVDAGGTAALAGVSIDGQFNDGSATTFFWANAPLNNVAIGNEGFTIDMKTPALVCGPRTGGFLTMRVVLTGAGAGAGPNCRIKQAQIRKRFSNFGV